MATNALPINDEGYDAAFQQLMSALDSRQSKGYNPALLAIAEGMLTPTATGSFGEGIGQAAKAVRGVQAEQQKEDLSMAQIRMQLAQQKYLMDQKSKSLSALNELYAEPTQSTTSAQPGQVSPSTNQVTTQTTNKSQQPAVPSQSAVSNRGWLPDKETARLMLAANNGDATPVLNEIAKARIEFSKPTDLQKDLEKLENPNVSQVIKDAIRAKYLETDAAKELKLLSDPNVDPITKQAIAAKFFEKGLQPFNVQTSQGTVQTNALEQLKKHLPQIFGNQAPVVSEPKATKEITPKAATTIETGPKVGSVAPTKSTFGAEPESFTTTSSGFKVPLPPKPAPIPTPSGFSPSSKEALEARSEQIKANTNYMYAKDGPLDKARNNYEAANNNLQNYTNVIDSVKNIKGGITAAPLQTFDKIIDAFGFSNPEQYRRMLSTATVDKVAKEVVSNELKSAFGASPTEGERKYLADALINISDPKELILFTALTKKAVAMRNISRYEYLLENIQYGLNAQTTFDNWARKQPLSAFEPELKNIEKKIIPGRGEAEAPKSSNANALSQPIYHNSREIVPNSTNTHWIYKDNGEKVPTK
jgi:hypothetical protein